MMAKRKYTSGVLATDDDGMIVFFWGQALPARKPKGDDVWSAVNDGEEGSRAYWREWYDDEWREQYSLRPPAPGQCFDCDVEL